MEEAKEVIIEGEDDTESYEEYITLVVESVTSSLWAEMGILSSKIDCYEMYQKNINLVEEFYAKTLEETRLLCIKLREESLVYEKEIMSSDKSNDEKYDNLEVIYDCIYDNAGDDIYDEIYDSILDEMYDLFYDGVLDDAYEFWSDMGSELWDDEITKAEKIMKDFAQDFEKLKDNDLQDYSYDEIIEEK